MILKFREFWRGIICFRDEERNSFRAALRIYYVLNSLNEINYILNSFSCRWIFLLSSQWKKIILHYMCLSLNFESFVCWFVWLQIFNIWHSLLLLLLLLLSNPTQLNSSKWMTATKQVSFTHILSQVHTHIFFVCINSSSAFQ